jgi:GNAT superfamily N-acetyltransferase
VANASAMFSIEFLTEKDWLRLKSLRLHALKESPGAFLASHKQEAAYSDERWRAEFARGEWMVAVNGGTTVGILGATRDAPTPGYERYLEYIWVLPGSRRSGVASLLIGAVLEYLTNAGVRTVCLWVNTTKLGSLRRCGSWTDHRAGFRGDGIS